MKQTIVAVAMFILGAGLVAAAVRWSTIGEKEAKPAAKVVDVKPIRPTDSSTRRQEEPRVAQRPAAEPASTAIPAEAPPPNAKQPVETAPDAKGRTLELGSKLTMTAPADWVRKTPKVRIIDYEFAIPAAKGDNTDGRMTVMAAQGGVEANVQRWIGQFTQPDGSDSKGKTKRETKKIAGREVHVVDISGTFKDSPGPFAPPVDRPNYRMLAAVVPTDEGDYFLKFYGPKQTVTENEKPFQAMIDSLRPAKSGEK